MGLIFFSFRFWISFGLSMVLIGVSPGFAKAPLGPPNQVGNQPSIQSSTSSPPAPKKPTPFFEFDLGAETWVSWGNTKWSHDASSVNPLLGNPTSELEYKDLSSYVVELNGEVRFRNGMFGRAQFGYGAIDDGTLIDDDYAAGQILLSRTESDIDGDHLWYVNADFGLQVVNFPNKRGRLRVFGGFQHWREINVAQGVLQVECIAIGVLCSPPGNRNFVGQDVITNTVKWSSIRVGVDSLFRFTRRFQVDGTVVAIPVTWLQNEDIHHLRTDLQQDPSFEMTGFGYGVNLEVGATYWVLPQWSLHAGFRFWWLRVEDGTLKIFHLNAPSSSVNLNEFESTRYGPTVGMTVTF